jgi:hypothetical protein
LWINLRDNLFTNFVLLKKLTGVTGERETKKLVLNELTTLKAHHRFVSSVQ